MTSHEHNEFFSKLQQEIHNNPDFASMVMKVVVEALLGKVEQAKEKAHQKDLALVTAIGLLNEQAEVSTISKLMREKLEQDIAVHGILQSSEYNDLENRLRNLCEHERAYLRRIIGNKVDESNEKQKYILAHSV